MIWGPLSRGKLDYVGLNISPFSVKSEQCDLGTVAIFCELPEDLYCKQNECFQHCCQRDFFYDPEKEICDKLSGDLQEQWRNRLNATLPHEDLDFGTDKLENNGEIHKTLHNY